METIKISEIFSDAPGGRYIEDGPKSGQEFRETILLPRFEKLSGNEKLVIDLDGCYGYATSFLEESFGGLARECGIDEVLKKIELISHEEPRLVDEIIGYIKDAKK